MVCKLEINKTSITLIVVYRPKPTSVNKLNVKKFWREFEKFTHKFLTSTDEILITGDLNFHLNKSGNKDALKLTSILDEFDLTQKIQVPTHVAGNTLDVLIARNVCQFIRSIDVFDPALCNDEGNVIKDHFVLYWTTSLNKLKTEQKTITYRAYNKIDFTKFEADLINSQLCQLDPDNNLSSSDIYHLYTKTLANLIDTHAPLQTRVIYDRPNTEWYNNTVPEMKRERRKAERKARSTGLEVHWEIFRQKSAEFNKHLMKIKTAFYSKQISDCKRNTKMIFQVTNSWMGTKQSNILPSNTDRKQLAQDFQIFFKEKVEKIHSFLAENQVDANPFTATMSMFDSAPLCDLPCFIPASGIEIQELMHLSNNKHCALDPLVRPQFQPDPDRTPGPAAGLRLEPESGSSLAHCSTY